MSNTMELCCNDCKESYWYGQTTQGKPYLYTDKDNNFAKFMDKHMYHNVHLENSYGGEHSRYDTSDYKRFSYDGEQ